MLTNVPQLPVNPVLTQARRLGDPPELAPDVVLVQHHPDRRREEETVVLPQLPRLKPVRGWAASRSHSAFSAISGSFKVRRERFVLVSPPALSDLQSPPFPP